MFDAVQIERPRLVRNYFFLFSINTNNKSDKTILYLYRYYRIFKHIIFFYSDILVLGNVLV